MKQIADGRIESKEDLGAKGIKTSYYWPEMPKRIEYENGDEILDKDNDSTGEFEQIPVEVDVYQELLDKEATGEIEIQWITKQEKMDKIAADKQNQINNEAQRYLDGTDWYELRELRDSTKPVPQDVLDKRQAAREAIT